MNVLETLEEALNAAQIELQSAEIASVEASARAAKARDESERLEAAVAALKGEKRAEPPAPRGPDEDIISYADRTSTAELSREEFEAARKKRQRAREQERLANDPLAQYKCAGCGSSGTTAEQLIQAPSGAPVRMLRCKSCGNQTIC